MQMQMQPSSLLSFSPSTPSFNAYSSGEMAAIAARVVEEFRAESSHPEFNSFHEYCDAPIPCQESDVSETNTFGGYCDASIPHEKNSTTLSGIQEDGDDVEDEDFEFAFVCGEPESSSISADEIFYNGQIRPIYPLFDTSLVAGISCDSGEAKPRSRRPQLRKLLIEEREAGAAAAGSCSSSEADGFEGLAPETYCVWTPKDRRCQESSPERCGKSNSMGTSKRWRLSHLMHRSNSDGKNTLVFLSPNKRDRATGGGDHGGGDHDGNGGDRDRNGGEKKKSILPYKQDFLGFLSNVNGLSRNLHPF